MRLWFLGLSLLVLALVLAGCRQTTEPTADNVTIDVALGSGMSEMGEIPLLITLTDADGNPIDGATVTVRGDMTHAGMVPILPDPVTDSTDGVYTVPFALTMGGDWTIEVTAELPNGEIATSTATFEGVDTSMSDDDMDMGDMDMSDEDMSNMAGTSGAYFTITNNRDADITLVSATAENIGMIEIHETIVDENDMASMQEIEGGLLIPAGETVELMPGGLHIMLMQPQADLVEGETLPVTLTFNDETTISLDVPIALTEGTEVETVESDDLTITGYWARPLTITPMEDADMDDMGGMDMDDEDSEDMDMSDDDMDMEEEAEATESASD